MKRVNIFWCDKGWNIYFSSWLGWDIFFGKYEGWDIYFQKIPGPPLKVNWSLPYIILPLLTFACELGSVVTRFDFICTKQVILSNLHDSFHNLFIFQLWSDMTDFLWVWRVIQCSNWLPTWSNFTFGQLEPDFYFSSHSGPEYFFSYNFQSWKQLCSYKSVTKLLYWGCLSVCVRPQCL